MGPSSSAKYNLLDQLAEEFAERYRRGERPSLREYQDRHPDLADEIRDLFPALVEVERAEADRPEPVSQEGTGTEAPPLRQVGDYRILREIGRGGMGVVYEAEQVSLGRRVALKVLSTRGLGDARAQERFRREARSAARLHHTNIVPVFEVGQEGDVCYYAMQLIQGQGLDQVIWEVRRLRALSSADPRDVSPASARTLPPVDGAPRSQALSQAARSLLTGCYEPATRAPEHPVAEPLPFPQPAAPSATSARGLGGSSLSGLHAGQRPYFDSVARVGQQTALALAHAHARGILHRDVKPSNLLLDESGVIWVTDFGLAKTEDDNLTRTGELPGTLRYMAPERFEGRCDARADVYALGLTLYELLVLAPAFTASDQLHLIEQIRNQEPPRPRTLDARVPRDLETVVLKAIDKDRRRRYPSADALAEDLRRFLGDEPIRARRAGSAERLGRWCRRNPAVAGLMAAVAVALLLGTVVAAFFAVRARANEERANQNALQSQTNETKALGEKAQADKARQATDAARGELQQNLYYAEMNLAGQAAGSASGISRVNELLAHWRPTGNEPDRRGWEWYYLDGLEQRPLLTLHRHTAAVRAVTWSPNGQRLASASWDGTVKVWDTATGRVVLTLPGQYTWGLSISWSPDGQRLASVISDGTVGLWDSETGAQVAHLQDIEGAHALYWSPDGKHLALAGSWNGVVRLWNVATGRRVARLQGHTGTVCAVSWSPDGRRLASAGYDHTVRVWDVATARVTTIFRGHTDPVRAVSWSPDGQKLASASQDQTVQLWSPDTGQVLDTLVGHTSGVLGVQWSPDGHRLASAGSDNTVRVWDRDKAWEATILRGHTSSVEAVCWSPDCHRLASAGEDQTVRVWDANARPVNPILQRHTDRVMAVSWSPASRWLASASADKTIKLWDVALGQEIAPLRGHSDQVLALSWSPDGRRLASGSRDQTIKLWDPATRQETATLRGHTGIVRAVSWSPNGQWLATGSDQQILWLWDIASGRHVATLQGGGLGDELQAISWSPDGQRLACSFGLDMGIVKLWDPATGQEIATLRGHPGAVAAVCWSPDGKRLASAGEDTTIKLWDAAKGQEIAPLRGHTGAVLGLSWSPDGRRLASASADRTVKLWDVATAQETLTLRGHTNEVRGVTWSPDGQRLASAGYAGTVRLWDATPGYEADRAPLLLPELDRRLEAHPRDSSGLRLRAEIEARLGQWDHSASDWTLAARLRENSSPPWFQAGWWVLGPFAPASQASIEPATDPDLLQPVFLSDQDAPNRSSLPWRAATATANGCLDLGALFSRDKPGFAYALLRVYSPREQPIAALIGRACPLHFWHNGLLLHQVDRGRPLEDDEGVPLTLRAGWNTLLFKVGIGTATDRLCVRLSAEPADRVRALAKLGRWDEAEAVLTDALKQQPDQPQPLLLAGRFFRERSDSLLQRQQKAGPDRDEQQARTYYEKLLARSPDHAGYAAELADFLLSRRAADHWEVLDPTAMVSAGGTTLTKQPDRSILASGKQTWPETYTITAQTTLTGIRAVRLELLTDPSLPNQGPGRSASGNIQLNEFRLNAAPVADTAKPRPVVLNNPWADFSDPSGPVALAIDGNRESRWSVWPRIGQPHVAVFEFKEAITHAGGTILTCALEQGPTGPHDHAVGCFRLSVTAHPDALREQQLRASLAGSAWTKLAVAHYLRGEWQAALAVLQKATAAPSASNGWDQLLLTLVHKQLGQHYEPGNAEGWIGRARAYLELAQPDKALADSARAVELQPKDLIVRRDRMEICLDLKKWHEALADCFKAIELKPGDPLLLTLRADLSACCGKWAAAADDFAKLTQMEPTDSRFPWSAWYRHALTLLAAGKKEDYRKASARMFERYKDTADAETAFFTAWTTALGPDALADFAPALRLAEKAAVQDSRSHQAVGAVLYRMGRLEESLKHFDAAAAAANSQARNSLAYRDYFRAMAHHRLGNREEARQWLQRAAAQADKELGDDAQITDPERWNRKATLQLLRAEAEAVLRGAARRPEK